MRRFAFFAALGLTIVAAPAFAQQQPAATSRPAAARPAAPMSETDRLNQMSLDRAKAGQNVLTGGPDTTQNLNAISEGAAARGQNMNQAPMPFR